MFSIGKETKSFLYNYRTFFYVDTKKLSNSFNLLFNLVIIQVHIYLHFSELFKRLLKQRFRDGTTNVNCVLCRKTKKSGFYWNCYYWPLAVNESFLFCLILKNSITQGGELTATVICKWSHFQFELMLWKQYGCQTGIILLF